MTIKIITLDNNKILVTMNNKRIKVLISKMKKENYLHSRRFLAKIMRDLIVEMKIFLNLKQYRLKNQVTPSRIMLSF